MMRLSLPTLPPSVNDMYMQINKGPKKLRVLSKEGRKFQQEATAYLVKHHALELKKFVPHNPYCLYMRFFLEHIENKGWPENARSRYKRLDASNRIKPMEDVIAEVSAVDDAAYFMSVAHKLQGTPERTEIYIWNLEKEDCPLYDATLGLR